MRKYKNPQGLRKWERDRRERCWSVLSGRRKEDKQIVGTKKAECRGEWQVEVQ